MACAMEMMIERIVTELTTACITNIHDSSKVGTVCAGRFEGKLDVQRIVISVLDFHPEKDGEWGEDHMDWEADTGWVDMPSGIIGGPLFEIMRGTVKLAFKFSGNTKRPRLSTSEAQAVRQRVLARARHALKQAATLKGFEDEFGVCVMDFQISRIPRYRQVDEGFTAYLDWAAPTSVPR